MTKAVLICFVLVVIGHMIMEETCAEAMKSLLCRHNVTMNDDTNDANREDHPTTAEIQEHPDGAGVNISILNKQQRIVDYDEALKLSDYLQASHVMIYAPNDATIWTGDCLRAAILMQIRFDGLLGFPGGLVDKGECPVAALNRELIEEVGTSMKQHEISRDNHLFTHVDDKSKVVMNFFALKVTLNEFCEIERGALTSRDYGTEVQGIVRPPLYTFEDSKRHKRGRGLPYFLCNKFAGTARSQLLHALRHCGILTQQEIDSAIRLAEEIRW